MRGALVGLGHSGRALLAILKSCEERFGFELTHVCDHHRENLAWEPERYPSVTRSEDFVPTLHSGKIELVFVTTRPESHYELTKASLEHGCHVFVEKPFVLKMEHADELVRLAEKKGLTLAVGHRLVYSPSVRYLRSLLSETDMVAGTTFRATWRKWGAFQSRGAHWDLASHWIAACNYVVAGKPSVVSVDPQAGDESGNVFDVTCGLEYPSGVIARIDVSWVNPFEDRQLVVNADGRAIWLNLNQDAEYPVTVFDATIPRVSTSGRPYYASGLKRTERLGRAELDEMSAIEVEVADFLLAASDGRPAVSSGEMGRDVVATLCDMDRLLAKPGF